MKVLTAVALCLCIVVLCATSIVLVDHLCMRFAIRGTMIKSWWEHVADPPKYL